MKRMDPLDHFFYFRLCPIVGIIAGLLIVCWQGWRWKQTQKPKEPDKVIVEEYHHEVK